METLLLPRMQHFYIPKMQSSSHYIHRSVFGTWYTNCISGYNEDEYDVIYNKYENVSEMGIVTSKEEMVSA